MTNKEAIDIIKTTVAQVEWDYPMDYAAAFDKAVEALEASSPVEEMPTVGGWISVKDDMPKEHDSIFANYTHLNKHMWTKESDNVIVYVRFPDGTGRSTEGRLQDGKWWTRISPTLEPVVTHWMPMPGEPKEAVE